MLSVQCKFKACVIFFRKKEIYYGKSPLLRQKSIHVLPIYENKCSENVCLIGPRARLLLVVDFSVFLKVLLFSVSAHG